MADETNNNEEQQKQELSDQLRESVASAYAFVQGQETTESFSAITFEELLDRQIATIEGPGTDMRPCVLDRIKKIKEDILSAVDNIKQQPDDFFKRHDSREDAITEPEPEDPLDTALSDGSASF